jgi:hypothetical protein
MLQAPSQEAPCPELQLLPAGGQAPSNALPLGGADLGPSQDQNGSTSYYNLLPGELAPTPQVASHDGYILLPGVGPVPYAALSQVMLGWQWHG